MTAQRLKKVLIQIIRILRIAGKVNKPDFRLFPKYSTKLTTDVVWLKKRSQRCCFPTKGWRELGSSHAVVSILCQELHLGSNGELHCHGQNERLIYWLTQVLGKWTLPQNVRNLALLLTDSVGPVPFFFFFPGGKPGSLNCDTEERGSGVWECSQMQDVLSKMKG